MVSEPRSGLPFTRRGLLVGAGLGGALVVGWALWPHHPDGPMHPRDGELAAGAWLRVDGKGLVTLALPLCEMGQGIGTVLAQVAAQELGADWRQMALEPAALDPAYADPVLAAHWAQMWLPGPLAGLAAPGGTLARRYAAQAPLIFTADGTALAAFEEPVRRAAATARELLVAAAAREWGVSADSLDAKDGAVIERSGAKPRRIGFGRLADAASRRSPPADAPLRATPPTQATPGPTRFPRLDGPQQVDGSLRFAADIRLPGMVHAAIAHGPVGDARLTRFDGKAAAAVPGFIALVEGPGWLAAVASHWFAADRAVKAAAPQFRVRGPVADSAPLEAAINTALGKGKKHRTHATGDPDALLAKPDISARYDVEPALPAPLEPAAAVAWLHEGRLDLWLATQAPVVARAAAARGAGLAVEDVALIACPAGGSFDARLDARIAAQVATIARAVQRPVLLQYARWQDSLAALPRAPLSAQMAAVLSDDKAQVLGWRARIAMPATARESGARLLDGRSVPAARAAAQNSADPMAMAGAVPPYRIPEMAVDHVPLETGLPTGRYRGNAHGYGCFITESFIDEIARSARREPLAFRMGMLEGQPRLAACLQGVARMAGWGGGADASGQGIACHRIDCGDRSGMIAVVATARRDVGGLRVERLSAFVDIGRIVDRDIALQQIEGGMVFGMGMTIGGSTAYARGLPLAGHLRELGLPLLADCPEIEVAFAASTEPSFDPGELGVAPVAPAIANALFSATGLRFRRLPLLSEGL